jgi:hypothetical protein
MAQNVRFTEQEIEEFEEIEFQKKRESQLQYVIHGVHISPRHKAYGEQKKLTANSAGLSSSPIQHERGKTERESECTDSRSDEECPSPEGDSQSQQANGKSTVAPVSTYCFSPPSLAVKKMDLEK